MYNLIIKNKIIYSLILMILFFIISFSGIMITKLKPVIYQSIFYLNERNDVSNHFNSFIFNTFVNSDEFMLVKVKDRDHKVHINPVKKIITITGPIPLLTFKKSLKDFKKNFYLSLPFNYEVNFKNCLSIENKDYFPLTTEEQIYMENMKFNIFKLNCIKEQELHGNHYFYKYLLSYSKKKIDFFDFHILGTKRQVDGLTSKQGLFISILCAIFSVVGLNFLVKIFGKK